jgi:PTH1 family peptidyl-tRNA hydrolase
MRLIIGLGNPDKKYDNTWHNLGFLVIDQLLINHDLGNLKKSWKFKAELLKTEFYGAMVVFAKPQKFMNNSGQAIEAITKFYKIIPEDVIVIHDDLDLSLGKIRISYDSSAGGHNGVKSIIDKLGSQKFIQIKIGIRTDLLKQIGAADYVLMRWQKNEAKTVWEETKKAADATADIINLGLEKAQKKWN